jgi:hypothetical protein
MVLIGIYGKLGSGKDYITEHVIQKFGDFLQLAFADQIKINVMTKNGVSFQDLYILKTQESRQLLQSEGTLERKSNENIWVDYLANWIKIHKSRDIDNFVITDIRFKNEYDFIKNNGGYLIKVIAPNRNESRLIQESSSSGTFNKEIYNKIKNHPSECNLDYLLNSDFDYIIYNDYNDNLNINTIIDDLINITM